MRASLIFAGVIVASIATPAPANWFSNPFIDINLNIGSAPNPSPDDILIERLPMLVRDAEGNVIAMIDSTSGKIIATSEPAPPAKKPAAPQVQTKPSGR